MLVSSGFDAALMAVLGLCVGSFLNVVIYRLPLMLRAQWQTDCDALSGKSAAPGEPFNLSVPRSRCPKCGHLIAWHENIPLLSYIFLRGKCSACATPIPLRYAVVEVATALMFLYCAVQWGISPTALAWSSFCACLLALALIDWDSTLLPDDLTLPLLWAGLLAAVLHWTPVALADAVWGAAAGYTSLWLVYWVFKLFTGKEGMGYGDFKLFAALGAWFGWQALIPMILMASALGAVVGIGLKLKQGEGPGGQIPFGPFLASAGLTALLVGPSAMLRAVGL